MLAYRRTENLGDAMQTVALARLLGDVKLRGVYRDNLASARPDIPFLVNGWIGESPDEVRLAATGSVLPPEPLPHSTLFCSISLSAKAGKRLRAWIKRTPRWVGSRDPYTQMALQKDRIPTEYVGCPTMAFTVFLKPRKGTYAIDAGAVNPAATRLTQHIPMNMTWREQWQAALARLDLLRKAELVYTGRLHVLLPCLAFRTPVIWCPMESPFAPERMSLPVGMGVPKNEVITNFDLTRYTRSQVNFLKYLDVKVDVCEPKFPEAE